MPDIWTITPPGGGSPVLLDSVGIESLSGEFVAGGMSKATARIAANYDAPGLHWPDDSLVSIYRNSGQWFQGRVVAQPADASGSHEGRTLILHDAWEDLDGLTYEEPWQAGPVSIEYPRAVLGQDAQTGEWISTGAQVGAAIDFAIGRGVPIQKGSIPTGAVLWPTEVDSLSVSQVIQKSTLCHPDWIPYLDHSTSPPTFNVVARASAATATHAPTDCSEFETTQLTQNVVNGVKIYYVSADLVDGEVYRHIYVDEAGVTTGRKVIKAVVDLAGVQAQFQKSRVQTIKIPDDKDEAQAYFRKKFPDLAGGLSPYFDVVSFSKELVPPDDDDDVPEPVNPNARRIVPEHKDELPRELLNGSIEDWMRVRVGKIRMEFRLKAVSDAPRKVKKMVDKLNASGALTVTGTNAITKLYKGITQWAPAEDVPTGVAAAVYAAASQIQYQGSIVLEDEDCSAVRYVGRSLILGGMTTGAMVNSHSWSVFNGTTRVSYGPTPYLSVTDLLDFQKQVRTRPAKWYSSEERTAGTLGAKDKPGSHGDTVAGFNQPGSELDPSGGEWGCFRPYVEDGDKLRVTPGSVAYFEIPEVEADDGDPSIPNRFISSSFPTINKHAIEEPDAYFSIGSSCTLWLICQRSKCSSVAVDESELDPERIVSTAKGIRPPTREENEQARPIADIDFETVDGKKVISEIKYHLRSDHSQFYYCGYNTDDNDGSTDVGDPTSADSDYVDPDDSTSDDDEDKDGICPMHFELQWLNAKRCFPPAGITKKLQCVPGKFTFRFQVKFILTDLYHHICPLWAFELNFPGAIEPRKVIYGKPNQSFVVNFSFEHAPACLDFHLTWKAKGARIGGTLEPPKSCCDHTYGGGFPAEAYKFGPVCGCYCSSPGDVDGDGIPNEEDPDYHPPTP